MTIVSVTNKWVKPVEASFEYVLYRFPINEAVEIPVEAARHIFGYEQENKVPYLTRLAFIQTMNDIPEGIKILDKFRITEATPKPDHFISPVVERVPLPNARRAGGNIRAA